MNATANRGQVDDHADKTEEIDGQSRCFVGMSFVQQNSAYHGACHAAYDDQQSNPAGIYFVPLCRI